MAVGRPLVLAAAQAVAATFMLMMSVTPAPAQGFGQPPFGQPGFGQPPSGPGFGQGQTGQPQAGYSQPGLGQVPYGQPPGGTQPGFNQGPPPMQPGMPSLVGAWSGTRQSPMGPAMQTDYFGPDNSFVSVAQVGSLLIRVWGRYQVTPTGPNQVRVDFQVQGYLPQQLCTQIPGGPLSCQAFQMPSSDASNVVFTSPSSFQATSLTSQDAGVIQETRDPNPMLLQRQVPQQQTVALPAAPQQMPQQAPMQPSMQPYTPPATRPYQPLSTTRPAGPRCDDLQQRRICAINDGRLVSSGGCLVCVSP